MQARTIVIVILLGVSCIIAAMLAMAWGPFQAAKAQATNEAMLVQANDLEGKWDASLDAKSKDNLDQIALRCQAALDLAKPQHHAAGANFEVPRALIYSFAQTYSSEVAMAKMGETFGTTFARCISSVTGTKPVKLQTGFSRTTRTVRFVAPRGYFDLTLATDGPRALFIAYSGAGRPATPGTVTKVLKRRAM